MVAKYGEVKFSTTKAPLWQNRSVFFLQFMIGSKRYRNGMPKTNLGIHVDHLKLKDTQLELTSLSFSAPQ